MILFYFKIDRIWDLFFLSFDNKILILRPQRKNQWRTGRFVFSLSSTQNFFFLWRECLTMASIPDIPQLRFAIKDRINKEGHKKRIDLMLEKDGMVKRWAIQKGLPQEPTHPTPYPAYKMSDLDLSTIVGDGPVFKNNVNVGEVRIVDSGTYQPIYWYENNVEIVLLGQKIKGTYTLFHNDKMKKKKDWLINKKAP